MLFINLLSLLFSSNYAFGLSLSPNLLQLFLGGGNQSPAAGLLGLSGLNPFQQSPNIYSGASPGGFSGGLIPAFGRPIELCRKYYRQLCFIQLLNFITTRPGLLKKKWKTEGFRLSIKQQ